MIESDFIRSILLAAVAIVFFVIAMRVVYHPKKIAEELGFNLNGKNGYNELYAIYLGVWLAMALIATYAAMNLKQPIIGDLVAILVLAQPVGRIVAIVRYGLPNGPLLVMFLMELLGGVLLLAVRPNA